MKQYKNYSDVEDYVWKKSIDKLCIDKNQDIVVFGCGNIGTLLMQHFDNYIDQVVCLCDNNDKRWGENRNGINVISPVEAAENYSEALFIIAIARGTDEIQAQLMSLGINKDNIVKLIVLDNGESAREYLSERLGDNYYLDNGVPAEATIPVIKSRNSSDRRDFRIYIEDGLGRKLDLTDKALDECFMDEYEKHYGKYNRLDDYDTKSGEQNSVKVMITCSHKDYATMESDNPDIYVPIQVGKALTDIQLYELNDADGENISDRNYNYCECSALYWAWKNGFAKDSDYLGLRHYRRKFEADDASLFHLKANNIDIVHLDPIYHGDIRHSFVNHTKNSEDWDIMKRGIESLFPEYYPAMHEYENQPFVCGYNMNILRRDIFDEYCEFLFGVLMYIENYYLERCDRRDRYLGFLAENIFGIFLIKNKDKYTQAITKLVPYIKY